MRSESAIVALHAIRDNIDLAWRFVDDCSYDRFCEDRQIFYAVTRALEIISEASRRLPDDVRDRRPDLPWRAIRDVGNFYRHEYDNVAEPYVWNTVQNHLRPLYDAISAEILRSLKE